MTDQEIVIDTLYYSVAQNNLELLKRLTDRGADIHYDNDKAFLLACYHGHERIVDYLLSKGANINATSEVSYENSPFTVYGNGLSLAAGNNSWLLYDHLLEKGIKADLNNSDALKHVALKEDIGRVIELIEKGASVKDSEALPNAIIQNQWEMAKFFLNEQNADVHVNDDLALRNSCASGNFEMVKFLVEKGANVNAIPTKHEETDEYGFNETALTCAIVSENWDIFDYLIANGADPNINKQEPFLNACSLSRTRDNYKNFVDYFIEKEHVIFNDNVFNSVVRMDDLELLKFFLLEYPKKDINEKYLLDNDTIYEHDRTEIFDYLLKNDYPISQKTRDMLVENNKKEFVKILLNYDLGNELSTNTSIGKKVKI